MFAIAMRIWRFSQFPPDFLMTWLREREHLKWGALAVLPGIGYLAAAYGLNQAIHAGAPAWLNLLVFVAVVSGLKLLAFGPISVVLLGVARLRESRIAAPERAR